MNYKALAKTVAVWTLIPLWFFGVPYWQAYTCQYDGRLFMIVWKGCTPASTFGETYGVSFLLHLAVNFGIGVILGLAIIICAAIAATYRNIE